MGENDCKMSLCNVLASQCKPNDMLTVNKLTNITMCLTNYHPLNALPPFINAKLKIQYDKMF